MVLILTPNRPLGSSWILVSVRQGAEALEAGDCVLDADADPFEPALRVAVADHNESVTQFAT